MLRRVGTSACRRYVIAPDTRQPDPPDRYRQAAIAAIVGRSGRRHPDSHSFLSTARAHGKVEARSTPSRTTDAPESNQRRRVQAMGVAGPANGSAAISAASLAAMLAWAATLKWIVIPLIKVFRNFRVEDNDADVMRAEPLHHFGDVGGAKLN